MSSPRMHQIALAKYQTIYAPVPAKDGNRDKTLDFMRSHRIISSVTADHVRDVNSLDRTSSFLQGGEGKRVIERGKSPLLKKTNTGISFMLVGDERSRSNLTTSAKSVPETKTRRSKERSKRMTGGFTTLHRDYSDTVTKTEPLPHSQPPYDQPPTSSTPGRANVSSGFSSPGPFYGQVRGTVKLSTHNRRVFTPNRIRNEMVKFNPALPLSAEHTEDIQPGNPTPVNDLLRNATPRAVVPNELLIEHSVRDPRLFVVGNADLSNDNNKTEVAEKSSNEPDKTEGGDSVKEGDKKGAVYFEEKLPNDQNQPASSAQPKPRLKINKNHLQNNMKVIVNNAFLPRDNTASGWMFRQKWLRLFARNGANGLAYAYSAKLQNSYS